MALAGALGDDLPSVVAGEAAAVTELARGDVFAVVAAPPLERPALLAARRAPIPVARVIVHRAGDGADAVELPPGDLLVATGGGATTAAMAVRAALLHARATRELYDEAMSAREGALRCAVRALARAFAAARPELAARCARISRMASTVAGLLAIDPVWPIELAALVYQLGALAVPPALLERAAVGLPLDVDDAALVARVTPLTEEILVELPHGEALLDIVHWRDRDFALHGDAIPLGARVLRAVADFDALLDENSSDLAYAVLLSRSGRYDPEVLGALKRAFVARPGDAVDEVREVDLDALVPGLFVVEDVLATNGMVLVRRGHAVTARLISLLRNFEPGGVRLPLRVTSVQP